MCVLLPTLIVIHRPRRCDHKQINIFSVIFYLIDYKCIVFERLFNITRACFNMHLYFCVCSHDEMTVVFIVRGGLLLKLERHKAHILHSKNLLQLAVGGVYWKNGRA